MVMPRMKEHSAHKGHHKGAHHEGHHKGHAKAHSHLKKVMAHHEKAHHHLEKAHAALAHGGRGRPALSGRKGHK